MNSAEDAYIRGAEKGTLVFFFFTIVKRQKKWILVTGMVIVKGIFHLSPTLFGSSR